MNYFKTINVSGLQSHFYCELESHALKTKQNKQKITVLKQLRKSEKTDNIDPIAKHKIVSIY